MKTDSTVVCFCCDKQMNNWEYDTPQRNGGMVYVRVHPMGGLHFETYGHYGSRVFDPMDGRGTKLDIAICDECLIRGVQKVYGTGFPDVHEIALDENEEYRVAMQKDSHTLADLFDNALEEIQND